jgi:hypothetical protein
MASEIIEYREYELHIAPYGSGLRVGIAAAGATFFRPEIPYSADKMRREQLIAEAKAIVDALLDPPHVKNAVD